MSFWSGLQPLWLWLHPQGAREGKTSQCTACLQEISLLPRCELPSRLNRPCGRLHRVCCQRLGQRTRLVLSRRAWLCTCGMSVESALLPGAIFQHCAVHGQCLMPCQMPSPSALPAEPQLGCRAARLSLHCSALAEGCMPQQDVIARWHTPGERSAHGAACRSTRQLAEGPEPRCRRASLRVSGCFAGCWLVSLWQQEPERCCADVSEYPIVHYKEGQALRLDAFHPPAADGPPVLVEVRCCAAPGTACMHFSPC